MGFQPFHLLSVSPWPILSSLSVGSLMINMFVVIVSKAGWSAGLLSSMLSTSLVCGLWWRDVIRESAYQGHHTMEVSSGIMVGMMMFICSEVMFFFSFFFSYFFTSLSPDVELGMSWPPKGVEVVSFLSVPFLNTLLLLSSGVSVTCAHYYMLGSSKKESLKWMCITVMLGVVFLLTQGLEYYEGKFTIADSVYGSLFYVMTGFHGIHVMIGVMFIIVTTIRLWVNQMSASHHLGFECSAWYWHFVDVVWLFLFIWLYWWGS